MQGLQKAFLLLGPAAAVCPAGAAVVGAVFNLVLIRAHLVCKTSSISNVITCNISIIEYISQKVHMHEKTMNSNLSRRFTYEPEDPGLLHGHGHGIKQK